MASVAAKVDHITHLPGAMIHHIFSFLPFKDVVKTSLLSKQWRSTWTSTPYIDLSLPSEDVVPSIDSILSLCTATKVEKFHLDAALSGLYMPTELDRWFRFAAAHKVEDASLGFGHRYFIEVYSYIFESFLSNSHLKVLSAVKVKGMSYLSSRWRNIIVYTTVCKREVLGMVCLLQSSPLLERLVICNPKSNEFTWKPYLDFQGLSNLDEKHFRRRAKKCYYRGANHLKRVTIVGFQFDHVRSKPLLALAKFLLEKAVGSEKMIIDAELRKSYRGVPIYPHDLIQLQKGCRRASRNAEVIVNYRFDGLPYVL